MDEFVCLKNFLKLSIIVPAFNNEKDISKCLTSLVHQNYDFNTYEILIVNDGSDDNTTTIVKEFTNQYNFIRLINKTRGGIPSAINLGIKHARGKYITFVNADSVVTNNLFINIVNLIETNNLDGFFFNTTDSFDKIDAFNESYISINKNELDKNINARYVYKASIIKQNNILYNELIREDIDNLFNYKYVQSCVNKIMGTNLKLCFAKPNTIYYPTNISDKKVKAIELYNSYLLSCNEVKNYKLSINGSKDLYNLFLTKNITKYLWCVITNKLNPNKAINDLKQYNVSLNNISIKLQEESKFKTWLQYQFKHKFIFKITCLVYKLFSQRRVY